MSYQDKYIKYKIKYLNLQNQLGGELTQQQMNDYFTNPSKSKTDGITEDSVIDNLLNNNKFINNLVYPDNDKHDSLAYKIFSDIVFMGKLFNKGIKEKKSNSLDDLLKKIVWAIPNQLNYDKFKELGLLTNNFFFDYFQNYANDEFKKDQLHIKQIITLNVRNNHKLLLMVDESLRNNKQFFIDLISEIPDKNEKDLIKLYASYPIRNELITDKAKFVQEYHTKNNGREEPGKYRFSFNRSVITINDLNKLGLLNGNFKIN
jgi:hypothetical protein